MGMHLLMKKPLVTALAVVVLAGGSIGAGLYANHASAPSSFVIATDRGNNQIDRIDLATRSVTVLLSNKVLPGSDSPDSIVFINDTQMLIDFINSGEIGIGDIQQHTYKSLGAGHGGELRDMALRPNGSGVLISDASGNILEFHTDTQKISTFARNLSGVQGLAFDSNGAVYAAVGGQVIQLDPATGKQLRTLSLPGGSDGMAYDGHHHTLDIAVGSTIVALDPLTGKTSVLIDGIATPDGLAIDRQGNLFIADNIGVLELNINNQLLIVGTNTNGIAWDDVAPLSGAGAASY
jgi:WD40 repeat protein